MRRSVFADTASLPAANREVAEAGLEEKSSKKPPQLCSNKPPAPKWLSHPQPLPARVSGLYPQPVCPSVHLSVCPARVCSGAGGGRAQQAASLVSDPPLGDCRLLQVSVGFSCSLRCGFNMPDSQGAGNGVWVINQHESSRRKAAGRLAWGGSAPLVPAEMLPAAMQSQSKGNTLVPVP